MINAQTKIQYIKTRTKISATVLICRNQRLCLPKISGFIFLRTYIVGSSTLRTVNDMMLNLAYQR